MSYVDLHLHLLPGVDDGPATEEQSIEHARRLARDCVREAVVTPHVGNPTWPVAIDEIAERTAALQAALDDARIPLRLRPGGEIRAEAAATLRSHELAMLAQGPPAARWVLLEVPFAGIDDDFVAGCRAIRDRGFGLVIAHPERAQGFLPRGLRRLRPEIEAGAVLQVNVCSLLGHHGEEARDAADWLIRRGLAYVLASDGHGTGRRTHTIAAGFALAVGAGATADHAWRLTQANPAFLLRHGLPRTAPATAPATPRPWAPAHSERLDTARAERRKLVR